MENLPVECISHILAFTSPKDVCRLAGVSSAFRSAADCELLWKAFLPEDYREIIALSSSPSLPPPYLNSLSAKALYFLLSDHPLLIDVENLSISISIEKERGFVCYMIGVKDLGFVSERPGIRHQVWRSHPQSRFCEVGDVRDYEFKLEFDDEFGMGIEDMKISPEIYCELYFVFNLPLKEEASILRKMKGGRAAVPWDDAAVSRADGWMEIEITGILTGEEGGSIVFSLKHHIYPPPSGWLIIQGIEFRTIKISKQSN